MSKFRRLPAKHKTAVQIQIKLMMAAHRDSLWNQWETCSHPRAVDPTKIQLICNEGYYGEAFGIVRALAALGFGYFGSDTQNALEESKSDMPETNLKWFFNKTVREYLDEEGFFDKSCTAEKCRNLLSKYRELARQD